jgi:hypothetical protein
MAAIARKPVDAGSDKEVRTKLCVRQYNS